MASPSTRHIEPLLPAAQAAAAVEKKAPVVTLVAVTRASTW
jgi:hypothetical protein